MTMQKDIEFIRGSTYALTIRWETPPVKYIEITAISQTAPVRITAPNHGAPDGARGLVTAAGGMREINAPEPNKVTDDDYHQITVIDANTVEFNDVNAASFRAYTSGGYLQYNTPKDVTGFSARMSVKAKYGVKNLLECSVGGVSGDAKPTGPGTDGSVTWVATTSGVPDSEWTAGATYSPGDVVDLEELIRLTSANGRIVINPALHTITLVFSATDTETLARRSGVYDFEMVSPDVTPVVTKLMRGRVAAEKEATTQ